MSMSMEGPRGLFVVDGLLVTNAIVDVGVGGIRARLARDAQGALFVVEDLEQPCLHDEHELARFLQELQLREPFGVTAMRAATTPFAVWPFTPGVPFERVFRARMAQGGCAPDAVVVEVGLAAASALARFGRLARPQEPDDISMLVWAGFDGSLSSMPRLRRVSPRTRYDPPDLAPGDERNERAHVFALGVLLHCLLFGVHPLEARAASVRVEDALQDIVVRCVHRAPRDRPSLEEARLRLLGLRAENVARADGFILSLLDGDRREQHELAEQVRMLSFVDASEDAPRFHTRPVDRGTSVSRTRKPKPLPG